jgi:hypothetical protein
MEPHPEANPGNAPELIIVSFTGDADDNRCSDCGHMPGCECPHDCDNTQWYLDSL